MPAAPSMGSFGAAAKSSQAHSPFATPRHEQMEEHSPFPAPYMEQISVKEIIQPEGGYTDNTQQARWRHTLGNPLYGRAG